ncbi:MAG: hypothetical protein ACLR8Q_01395 [[Ruminococcus] lactaris]|uniref:hypothetical protein n=1 Tax=[Ruminococcus] lactaris TaxID=46228 RepID=UPI0039A2D3FF
MEEWEEAVTYILGLKRRPFPSPASARRFLQAELEKAALSKKTESAAQEEIVTFKNSDFFKGV